MGRRRSLHDNQERGIIMTIREQQTTIAEQELITMLSQLCPVAIRITPCLWEDGSTVYGWQAWESSGTHPTLLGAVQAALEAAMVSLAYAPVSPEARLTQADFPLTFGHA
jgi:hypothetical protein